MLSKTIIMVEKSCDSQMPEQKDQLSALYNIMSFPRPQKKKPKNPRLMTCYGRRKPEIVGSRLWRRGLTLPAPAPTHIRQRCHSSLHSPAADQRVFTGKSSPPKNTRVSQSFSGSDHNLLPETPLKLFYSSKRCHLLPAKVTEGYFPHCLGLLSVKHAQGLCSSPCNSGLAGPQHLSNHVISKCGAQHRAAPINQILCEKSLAPERLEGPLGSHHQLQTLLTAWSVLLRRPSHNGRTSCPCERWDLHLAAAPAA